MWTIAVEAWSDDSGEWSQIVVSNDDVRIMPLDFDTMQAQWLCDQLNEYETLKAAVREYLDVASGRYTYANPDKALDALRKRVEEEGAVRELASALDDGSNADKVADKLDMLRKLVEEEI